MHTGSPGEPAARQSDDTLLTPRILACGGARLLALSHTPRDGTSAARLTILPPWGEEENRSRAMLAALARRLAAGGIATTLLNLSGTGESWPASPPCTPRQWADELAAAARLLGGPSRPQDSFALLACRQMADWCAGHVLPILPAGVYAPVLLWDPPERPPRHATGDVSAAAPPIWARAAGWKGSSGVVVLRSPHGRCRIWTGREGRIDRRLLDWVCAAIGSRLMTGRTETGEAGCREQRP